MFTSPGPSPATVWIGTRHSGAGVAPHIIYQVGKEQKTREKNERENLIITDQQWNVIFRLKRGLMQRFSEKTHKGSLLFIWSAHKQKDFYSLLLLKSAQSQSKRKWLYIYYIFEGDIDSLLRFSVVLKWQCNYRALVVSGLFHTHQFSNKTFEFFLLLLPLCVLTFNQCQHCAKI